MFNILTLFTDVVTIIGDAEADEAAILSGTPVTLPGDVVVGSTDGKSIYLIGTLTTTKPTPSGISVPGGWNVGAIFSDVVKIEGEVLVDTGELDAGMTVPIPAVLQVASFEGTPVYLDASLTTTKP
jgi:hypothetical protein